MPFAKSSVRLGRMTHTGSIRFFPKTRLKSRLGGGEVVYSRLWAFHAQFAEVQPKNELCGTLPAENAREEPKGRYGEVPTVNAARVGQRVCRDSRAERAAGALKRNHSSLFTPPLSRLRRRTFAPVAQILRSGELRCEWTMLVPNEAVIRHG
jgi:hypothetical protein